MAVYARRLGLHGLSAAYLQSIGGDVGVEGHVLCLEGRGMVAVLKENTAEGCGHHALAYVTAGACQHQGMKRHLLFYYLLFYYFTIYDLLFYYLRFTIC